MHLLIDNKSVPLLKQELVNSQRQQRMGDN